jgi:hypothetical protein
MELTAVIRLTRDIAKAAETLSDDEARFLVDAYYVQQEARKRSNNQVDALEKSEEPNAVLSWLATQSETLENQIKRALDGYTKAHIMGAWMRQIKGIGPVLSAGLLAHIDIKQAPTAGHIWRFAGLDPTSKWEKGNRRPWNSKLKTLCWKIGQSFLKCSNDEECFYGSIYRQRKLYEITRNDSGGNAQAAAAMLIAVPKHAQKTIYAEDILPPAQIDARARRYAVKLFLSHLHGAWYQQHFGKPAPLPYPIAQLGHAHMIEAR